MENDVEYRWYVYIVSLSKLDIKKKILNNFDLFLDVN